MYVNHGGLQKTGTNLRGAGYLSLGRTVLDFRHP